MKSISAYRWFLVPVLVLVLAACVDNSKKMNRRVTLWRKDKIPYGTYYAFENLKYVFPAAGITVNKYSPADYKFYQSPEEQVHSDNASGRIGYVVIAPIVVPDERELKAMMNFVGRGNQIFISAFYFGDSLLNSLGARLNNPFSVYVDRDSMQLSIYDPKTYDSLSFSYPGLADDNSLSRMDTEYTSVLGRDAQGRPDFVKFGYKGGGAIFLHFAPTAFSNFFLLHKDNKVYYDQVFSYLSPNIRELKWDEYYRYPKNNGFSALKYILSSRPLRWALWMTLLLFLVVYLFESKRRQRIISTIPAMRNSSLDFVKTVGRLYFQRRDNGNLASKLSTHFLEFVRNRYNIPTSRLDEEFMERLSYKSAMRGEDLKALIEKIREYQDQPQISDEELMNFNKKIEEFYKQA